MKTILIGLTTCPLLIVCLLTAGCTTARPAKPVPDQEQQLALAYKTQSPGKLDTFFQRWAAETPPFSALFIPRRISGDWAGRNGGTAFTKRCTTCCCRT